MIPHSRPFFDADDERALTEVLRRRYVTAGPEAARLGAMGAELLGKTWGIPVQSGTDALTAALYLLGVGKGDRVAVSAYMCSAPLDAIAAVGAIPILVDADRSTLAIDIDAVNALTRCDAVIAAHMFGCPAPVHRIRRSRVVEDCAQTLGVSSGGKPVGASGTLAVGSFYGTKLVAAGHGGILAGNAEALKQAADELFNHDKQDCWRFHFHFLMSDLVAALGASQIAKVPWFVEERRALAAHYLAALGGSVLPPACAYSRFLLEAEDVEAMIGRFESAGIEAKRPVFRPLPAILESSGHGDLAAFPVARWAHEHILSVPIYPGMPEADRNRIVTFLEEYADALRQWPPV